MKKLAVVILAAGEGTRMKSALPKVLHTVAGRPMIEWVLAATSWLKPAKIVVVVGNHAQQVKEALGGQPLLICQQKERLGTAHALKQAAKFFLSFRGDVLVICGDTPLVESATLKQLVAAHRAGNNAATVLSAKAINPFSYGRINRSQSGDVVGIVEEKDCTAQQRLISEINSGMYCFSPLIWQALSKIKNNNAKREYYLTDAISILHAMGKRVDAKMLASMDEIMGINDRINLADAETIARKKTLNALMRAGVTIENPLTTIIGPDITIGADTVIRSGSIITGKCSIGANCEIGPYSVVSDSAVGDGCKVGPFAHLRPGTVLKTGAKVGNFCEVKKSVVGCGSKVNHLSYIGDAVLGSDVNIGAGTITCNYDGKNKFKTTIGDRAFVGSNTNFVAPVTVGAGALIAAGSTITENIPKGMLAIARARQINKKRIKS